MILAAKNAGAIGYVVKRRLGTNLRDSRAGTCAGRPFLSPAR